MDDYFKNHKWTEPFLTTDDGRKYAPPFRALRLKHLVLHQQDVKVLQNDNIIPPEWMHDVYREQWLHLLRIDENEDRG